MLPTGMISLCQPRKPDPTVIRYWQALIESWRGPTIGRTTRRGLSSPLPGRVYVGQPNVLGNPFQIGRDGTREQVIDKYRAWLWDRIRWTHPSGSHSSPQMFELQRLLALARDAPLELLCWCAPLRCHAEVIRAALLWLADQQEPCTS